MGDMEDVFVVDVESVEGEGNFTGVVRAHRVSVQARTSSEATLVAAQMVAAVHGACPVSSRVDWENF